VRDPVLVVAIDGAHTPIRPPGGRKDKRGKGEWKQTKGVRIYLASDSDRIVHVSSWHRNGDKNAFAWDPQRSREMSHVCPFEMGHARNGFDCANAVHVVQGMNHAPPRVEKAQQTP
jgi:hypothetical protein